MLRSLPEFNPKVATVVGILNRQRPTFPQFVQYLLATDPTKYNDHWIPFWLHCHLCDSQYDIIGKWPSICDSRQVTLTHSLCTVNCTVEF